MSNSLSFRSNTACVTIAHVFFGLTLAISLATLLACSNSFAGNSPTPSQGGAGTVTSVPKTIPVPSLIATPMTGTAPLSVAFVVTCSTCVAYTWSFGDGGVQSTQGPDQTYTYSAAGTFTAIVAAVDIHGKGGTAEVIITVNPVVAMDPDNIYCAVGNTVIGELTDGPASTPEKCVNSSLANTPSPGITVALPSGGDFQTAYNALSCGQTLSLAHGVTWNGPFQFTPKGCDDQHWITIATDGSISAPGTRINATYLPQLAVISMEPGSAANMIVGDHIRFTGIAWLKQSGKPLVDFVEVPGAVKIIFDRNYVHGNPGEEARRFIDLTNGSYVAIVDSLIDEMHCLALGSCTDSQTISGGLDTVASGPFKIVNNELSAAGENILFGGGSATNTPCDIEIRGNYLYKPASWNPSDPTYIGIKYVVKNLFELKNACRVLAEGNVMANTWGGFTQNGSAVLIGPKNQGGANHSNLCPLCFVSDVIFRYGSISSTSGAFEIFNVRTTNVGGWASGGHNYSIHDIVADNLQYATCYMCATNLAELSSGYLSADPPPTDDVMHDVLIDHLTLVTVPTWPLAGSKREAAMMLLDGPPAGNSSGTPLMSNITFENSLFGGGNSGFYPTGGGADNCSVGQVDLASMISNCWSENSLFSGNVTVAYTGTGAWPQGTLLSPSWSNVGFANYNNGVGGDYHLLTSSPFKGLALDGDDPGANIDLVNFYTQNAEQ
jgi:PKD repeat protein